MRHFKNEFEYSEDEQDKAVQDYYQIVLEAASTVAGLKPGRPATVIELEIDEKVSGAVIIALDLKRCPANVQAAAAHLIGLLRESDEALPTIDEMAGIWWEEDDR
jgi:hypothetical protein